MREPKLKATVRRQINRELFEVTKSNPLLGVGIDKVYEILDRFLGIERAEKVAGIYCGQEGRSFETFDDLDSGIVLQWCYGKLEVAYVS